MKRKYMLWLTLGMLLALPGCREEEDSIIPSENYTTPIRFEFPQGKDSWDQDIKKIYDEYGICPIYKNYTKEDLNRNWASSYVIYQGEAVTPERVPIYIGYLKNHILDFMTNELVKRYFPLYIYFADDLGVYYGDYMAGYTSYMLNGMDCWTISFWKNSVFPRHDDNTTYTICYKIYSQGTRNGIIVEPPAFSEGIDYKTPIVKEEGKESDPNYYVNRGFVDILDESFGMGTVETFDLSRLVARNADFLNYLRTAMFLPEEQFKAKYPATKYPRVNQRYEFITNYMKMTYGIDLKKFANITKGLIVK